MSYSKNLGKRLADFDSRYYNPPVNNASRGQCVWYTQGRAYEKTGVFIGARGNGKEVLNNCKKAGFQISKYPKTNSIACFGGGTYGHVKYVEYVIADTVFYTEANSNSDNEVSPDDGVLKKMTFDEWMAQANLQGHVVVKTEKLIPFKIVTESKKLGLYKSRNAKKKNKIKTIRTGKVKAVAGSGRIKNGRDVVKILYKNRYYWAIRKNKANVRYLRRVK